jgi:hypothetical protein
MGNVEGRETQARQHDRFREGSEKGLRGGFSSLRQRNAREMVVGHIRTLMNGSRTSVPIFPKIAFEGVVVIIARAHIGRWEEKRTVRSFCVIS